MTAIRHSSVVPELLYEEDSLGVFLLVTVVLVAPLWLKRAKYEEQLLLESLGQSYREYAEQLKWRRLIPRFIPIGV